MTTPTCSITVVTGPPCAGKTTHVQQQRDPEHDVVLDVDHLAHALGYPAEHIDWDETHPHPARIAAMLARASILKRADQLAPRTHLWIISTYPRVHGLPPRFAESTTHLVIDPGPDECHRRARTTHRPEGTHPQIDRWYASRPQPSRTW